MRVDVTSEVAITNLGMGHETEEQSQLEKKKETCSWLRTVDGQKAAMRRREDWRRRPELDLSAHMHQLLRPVRFSLSVTEPIDYRQSSHQLERFFPSLRANSSCSTVLVVVHWKERSRLLQKRAQVNPCPRTADRHFPTQRKLNLAVTGLDLSKYSGSFLALNRGPAPRQDPQVLLQMSTCRPTSS